MSPADKPNRRRAPRASAACDFCRRRKLGCNNAKPKCDHCVARDIPCTYARRTKQARPSNARIHELEEENARLRSSGADPSPPPSNDPSPACRGTPDSASNIEHTHSTVISAVNTTESTNTVETAGSDVPYQGASSVLSRPGCFHEAVSTHPPETSMKDSLLAATTRQRQLEMINTATGKLDFGICDPQTGTEILACFWNRQHYGGTVVYRPVFMRDMASGGPYFSKILLYAMLFAGSKHRAESSASGDTGSSTQPFRVNFEEMLHDPNARLLIKSNITTIQALLIVADSLFAWRDETSLSWHYVGIAISMMVDLGIHVDIAMQKLSKGCTVEDVEVHRRVFWAAFALDKVQSIYQGRPARLREMDNGVPIKFLDEYDELEPFNTLSYEMYPQQLTRPAYSVSTFKQLCKLSIIMDRILSNLYAEKMWPNISTDPLDLAKSLHDDLRRWKAELPCHLAVQVDDPDTSTILPHTLSLLAMYHSIIILLHRPFVSDLQPQSTSTTSARVAFAHCTASAMSIHRTLQLYRQHFRLKTVPYFISYATYVSATIHARVAALSGPDPKALFCLRYCIAVLAEQQIECKAPRRTLNIVLGLCERLKVDVGDVEGIRASNCPESMTRVMEFDQDVLPGGSMSVGSAIPEFDIDEIMRSFEVDQQSQTGNTLNGAPGNAFHDQGSMLCPDSLFGFDFDMGELAS